LIISLLVKILCSLLDFLASASVKAQSPIQPYKSATQGTVIKEQMPGPKKFTFFSYNLLLPSHWVRWRNQT